jgi:uncharacterized membrane protein YqgA involved in biofilm formation
MIGTLLNVGGILIGGTVGLLKKNSASPARESTFKVILGAFTVFYGLRLTWLGASENGTISHGLKLLGIAILSLMLGKLIGQLLGLQKFSNRIGQQAKEVLSKPTPASDRSWSDGFRVCAGLFCAAPLGLLGAVSDGLSDYYYPLAIKGVIDGLATMGIVSILGWSPLLAALPVLVVQGTITLLIQYHALPFLVAHHMVAPINATTGLLVFAVALVILQLKRLALADYLPSVVVAAGFGWLWNR